MRLFSVRVVRLVALNLAVLSCALPTASASAADVVLKYGDGGGGYERSGIGIRLAPVWSDDWGGWDATLRPEVELSRFRYTGSRPGPDGLTQGGAIGLLRLQRDSARVSPYAEVGLGAAMLSRDRLGNKELSTRFQFSQHVGLGLEFAAKWWLGWQYSHYSNGDIEKPNDGLDVHQIVVGARF